MRIAARPRTLAIALAALALAGHRGTVLRASEPQSDEALERAGRHDGRHEKTLTALKQQAERAPSNAQAQRALARALVDMGRYLEAEQVLRRFAAERPASAEVMNALGELLAATGRLEEAEASFVQALGANASDRLVAELNLAVLRDRRGEREAAVRGFDALIDAYNRRARLTAEELLAVGTACRHLGQEDPQLFKDAVKAYEQAIRADPQAIEARVRLGELFLEKYNSTDAAEVLKEALERDPEHPAALVAEARRRDFDGLPGGLELVRRSLETNPSFAAARLFLSRHWLESEDYPQALREAEEVLALNPASLEALSLLAAARYLQGDQAGYDEARTRALRRHPRYADLFNTVAELCVRNRLYGEAVVFARRAVELDPKSSRALGLLGVNQLRLGLIDEGRRNLDAAFRGDPYDVWTKNTLDLLDTFPQYRESASPRFRFWVHGKEAALLSPYLAELAEEAYDKLAARYRHRPQEPIRVEVYPSHADFSVRTVGLAGLGALGVCFGPVLAIDSPSARPPGKFNWGSTLWHELGHVFTLALTGNRVPRWFTEGLAVLEERRARLGWGDDVSLDFLVARKQGRLLPLARLNDGFVRPEFPGQVALSYYQASLVVELLERDRGFESILKLLEAFKHGRTTEQALQEVLGTGLDDVDRRFAAFVDERFGRALAAVRPPEQAQPRQPTAAKPSLAELERRVHDDPGDFLAQLRAGHALVQEKKLDEAVGYLERAKALLPEYAEEGSPYRLLAAIHRQRGAGRRAAEELASQAAINETDYAAHVELAELRQSLGEPAAAADALERALYIHPLDPALHTRLAVLYAGLGDWSNAVRERRAVVALKPVDLPEALYELALALAEAGEPAEARREVVRALELAPAFDKAQQLLLRLHRGGAGREGRS